MNSNNSNNFTHHIMDDFPHEMQLASKSAEFLILPLYIGFIIQMFKGIEINHPGMMKPNYTDHLNTLNYIMKLGMLVL
jgi:hypothetical protein